VAERWCRILPRNRRGDASSAVGL